MLRSSLCDYSYAYILVSGTITITGAGDNDAAQRLEILKIFVSFSDCVSEINNTQIGNAKYIDVVMPM